ncbi:hypothetical protein BCR42DRAFT_416570 [Absidia repens]|uniref:Uncharacterized protein n=1 Tax=Absidia repens TaxID=90262 RepID=A0A1X2IF10_9FUNG|nr:hypothetical protein BCR42DRAFT_416570 [Absidia repens]
MMDNSLGSMVLSRKGICKKRWMVHIFVLRTCDYMLLFVFCFFPHLHYHPHTHMYCTHRKQRDTETLYIFRRVFIEINVIHGL